MHRKTVLCSIASVAMIPAAAAVAGSAASVGAATTATMAHPADPAAAHPAQKARSHAGIKGVLRGNAVVGGHLDGLTVGMHVVDTTGAMIGTVSKFLTASGGRVVNVLVKPHSGARTIPMSPGELSLSGGMVTTAHVRGKH